MKCFTEWELDKNRIPTDLETKIKGNLIMMEMIKADLNSGAFTDWGIRPDASEGYIINEVNDINDILRISGSFHKYMPYTIGYTKPVLSIQQAIGIIQSIIASFGTPPQSEAKK